MENIRKLMIDLDWHAPLDVQERAMEELKKVDENEVIILADLSVFKKSLMHNTALVLKEIGYPRIKKAIPYLMEWFKDANWPGVDTIVELLTTIDKQNLFPGIEQGVAKAVEDRDRGWCYFLGWLFEKLNVNSSDFQDQKLFNQIMELKEEEENAT